MLETDDDDDDEDDQFPDQSQYDENEPTNEDLDMDGEDYEDEFTVGFGGDEHVMQSVWTKTHNELGKFQSQRRPDMIRNNYEAGQFDFDQAYQSGKCCYHSKNFLFLVLLLYYS